MVNKTKTKEIFTEKVADDLTFEQLLEKLGVSIGKELFAPIVTGALIRDSEIRIVNSEGKNIFSVLTSGPDQGDIIIGDYDGGQGIKYDASAGTITYAAITVEWADVADGASTKPDDNAQIGSTIDKEVGENVTAGKVATTWKVTTHPNADPLHDTQAEEENPDTNRNAYGTIVIKNETNKKINGYFNWSKTGLPVDDATHEIISCHWYVYGVVAHANAICKIQMITESWAEGTLTWNNKPASTGNYQSIAGGDLTVGSYVAIDVTNWYRDFVSTSVYGIALIPTSGTGVDEYLQVGSNAGSNPTYLVVKYRTKDGKVYTAIASDGRSAAGVFGFFQQTKNSGETARIAVYGIENNQSGLTLNQRYYLADSGGGLSSTPGTVPVMVGKGLTATKLVIYPNCISAETIESRNVYVLGAGTYHSSDGAKGTTLDDYTLLKEFTLPGDFETQDVSMHFELKTSNGSYTAYGKIQKNGSDHGTVRSTVETIYQGYTESLSFSAGDRIQLWVKISSDGATASIQNFRMLGSQIITSQKYAITTYAA